MISKYFDLWETKNIFKNYNINIFLAKKEMEDYLQKYPNDNSMFCYYASLLISLSFFNQAGEILNKIEKSVNWSKENSELLEHEKNLKHNYVYTKLRYLIYNGQYQEFIDLYSKHINYYELIPVKFYCEKKLNLLDPNRRSPNSYLYRQIVEYKIDDFLEHIKKHQANYNEVDNPNSSIFVPDFPIEDVILETKKYIPGITRINSGFMENVYIFKYDDCGHVNNKMVNFFKIVCFNSTSDYITMCPADDFNNIPFIDLNYLKKDDEKAKVKQLSQIEKFNKKYKF